ncbi:hypothetical protein FB566_2409 [Stackebrandtia endophytica]|uniref:Uncharacterized protein n=1 Tax=Stackebrandtia endophytica TaxID=1496996 RepID=A0A543AWA3_9ACTN|nr:hypothetical protein [Stackebrandtia endophytica]TQL76867.1 hypothetical protein FB566_2409 [Stackebrandtia endophytica]
MSKKQRSRIKPVKEGYLPITELTSPMAASGSPFGDDVTFPLPVRSLNWEHSEPAGPHVGPH